MPNNADEGAQYSASGQRLEMAAEYASDVGVLGALRALTRLRGLILLPVIAGDLGPAAYGIWTQSLVAVALGSSFIDLQLHSAVVRFASGTQDRGEQRAIFVPSVLLVAAVGTVVAAGVWAFPAPVSSIIFGDPAYVDIARWLGVWIATAGINRMGMHLLRGLHKVKLYGIFSSGQVLVQLATVAGVVLATADLLLGILAAVAVELATAVVLYLLCARYVGLGWPGFHQLRRNLAFSLPLVPSYYGESVLSAADRVIIAARLGPEAIGVYAAAYSLARLVREIIVPISMALLPAVSRSWDKGEREQSLWLLSNTVRYYLLLALPALVGIVLVGPRVLVYLASADIAAGVTALLPLIGLGLLLASIQTVFAILIQLREETHLLGVARIASALLYVSLVFLAVPRWGLIGGALATALGYGIDLLLTVMVARREAFTIPWRAILKSLAAATLMAPFVLAINGSSLGDALGAVLVGVISYSAVVILLKGLGRRELDFLISLVNRNRKNSQLT